MKQGAMEDFNLDNFFGENTFMKALDFYETVHKETFTVKDLSIPHRDIQSWGVSGLLNEKRVKESTWRVYNFMDYCWVQIVRELKLFGVSSEVIKNLKAKVHETIPYSLLMDIAEANLEELGKTAEKEEFEEFKNFLKSKERKEINKDEGISILLLLIVESITTKAPINIVTFADGDFLIWNESKKVYSKDQIEKLSYESYISVSMAKIIRRFLYNNESSFIIPALSLLKENEIKLLEMIHSGEYESITISFKNKKMKSLNLVKEQDVKKRVVDVLALGNYQDISIKTHNGMITKIQNTVKVRLD